MCPNINKIESFPHTNLHFIYVFCQLIFAETISSFKQNKSATTNV